MQTAQTTETETETRSGGGAVRTLRLPPTPRNLQGLIVTCDPPAGTDVLSYREHILARFGITLREEITGARERREIIDMAWDALPWQDAEP